MELPSLHPICPFFGFLFNVLDLSKASLPLHLAILGTKHPMSKPMETYWLRNDFLIKPSWKKKKEEFIHKPVRGRVTLETGTKLGMSGVNMLVNMGNSQMARYKKKSKNTPLHNVVQYEIKNRDALQSPCLILRTSACCLYVCFLTPCLWSVDIQLLLLSGDW